jgi:DeoR/GlpR family transcriptional regulator of sugar metabolism
MAKEKEKREKVIPEIRKDQRFVSVDQAAVYLCLSPQTIYNGIAAKAKKPFPIKPRRYGGKPLFEKAELDRFADSLPR